MTPAPRIAALGSLSCLLAGCVGGVDAGQARTCRSVIPAINPSDATFAISRIRPLASNSGVRVDYKAFLPNGPSRSRFLECRFAGWNRAFPEFGGLIGLTTDSGQIGDLRCSC